MDTVSRVGFHDVLQNRLATNLNHGLGTKCCFFANARSQTACQYNRFQE